jgi:hypothetical protein
MNTIAELVAYQKQMEEKYPDLKNNLLAAQEARNHPDYSHSVVKQRWEDNWVYFYVECSPTRVMSAFVFGKEMLKHLESPLTIAVNNKW